MKLENIGFYTLSDKRAINSSITSPLWRCELLITDRCNFQCPYCRGLQKKGDIDYLETLQILDFWFSQGLKNIRFSGGEPTLYPRLKSLVDLASHNNVERIAISTNGSMDLDYYKELMDLGVNDFSISLDACCSATNDIMAGVKNKWDTIIFNIKELSKMTYVTVGIVVNEFNLEECHETVLLADSLGVSDIRIIPSAQFNQVLDLDIPKDILSKYPILDYRLNNYKQGRNVRGIQKTDSERCGLAMDDMAVLDGWHYPCIIYLREQGEPIGKIDEDVRLQRYTWALSHNTHSDKICKDNCLDVCIDYNNKKETTNDKTHP